MASTIEGLLSKGMTLKADSTVIAGLQEVPQMGGAADKVDVTTLEDGNYRYINGIKDFGDLAFTFLYDDSTYDACKALDDDETHTFVVTFPDSKTFTFTGFASVATAAAAVNGALQFTLNINLNSDITVA